MRPLYIKVKISWLYHHSTTAVGFYRYLFCKEKLWTYDQILVRRKHFPWNLCLSLTSSKRKLEKRCFTPWEIISGSEKLSWIIICVAEKEVTVQVNEDAQLVIDTAKTWLFIRERFLISLMGELNFTVTSPNFEISVIVAFKVDEVLFLTNV